MGVGFGTFFEELLACGEYLGYRVLESFSLCFRDIFYR